MDRNLFIAFVLSAVVVFGYYSFFPPAPIKEVKKVETKASNDVTKKTPTPTVTKTVKVAPVVSAKVQEIHVDTPLYKLTLTTDDGMLMSFLLKNHEYDGPVHTSILKRVWNTIRGKKQLISYKRDKARRVNMAGYFGKDNKLWKFSAVQLQDPVIYQTKQTNITVDKQPQTLELTATLPNGLQVVKKLTFHNDSYIIDMQVVVNNTTQQTMTIIPKLVFGSGNEYIRNQRRTEKRRVVSYIDKSMDDYDTGDIQEANNRLTKTATWAGVSDLYFVSVVKSSEALPFVFTNISRNQDGKKIDVPVFSFLDKTNTLAANKSYSKTFHIYSGPKLPKYMEMFDAHLHMSQDFGWFAFIAEPLLSLLRFLQKYTINWGLAIICLTIIVRLFLFPFAYKSMKSMKRMSQLNPKVKKLRKKYAKDPQRMNKEIMALYKKNKASPVGGCLPMIIQIPIFIGLYKALLPAAELRHAPFLFWLQDLSAADYTLVLPILMGITIFLQQMVTTNPSLDATQAKMLKWMPLVMTLFFLDMPSALVLYWVCSNAITILQQWIFNKAKMPEVQD